MRSLNLAKLYPLITHLIDNLLNIEFFQYVTLLMLLSVSQIF